ncbi:hypothetical protein GH714_034702 [Hevea brasiliensis]|uniref:Uncharacterized protein n=1 Tax=Hevea brasiliensis TaxID=3981 RepID=A0A6A6KWQ6_HEVBR|nr:hypothetical protein GH714_034702 [Hevea brasiliensis]
MESFFDNLTIVDNEEDVLILDLPEIGEKVDENQFMLIHDVPLGCVFEPVARQLGNYTGTFISYDSAVTNGGWKSYMRIRVALDVRVRPSLGNNDPVVDEGGFSNSTDEDVTIQLADNNMRQRLAAQQLNWEVNVNSNASPIPVACSSPDNFPTVGLGH